MKVTEAKTQLMPFIEAAKKDNDPYFVCHFSREEDKYRGYHEGLDIGDALIIIKELVDKFGIDPKVLKM